MDPVSVSGTYSQNIYHPEPITPYDGEKLTSITLADYFDNLLEDHRRGKLPEALERLSYFLNAKDKFSHQTQQVLLLLDAFIDYNPRDEHPLAKINSILESPLIHSEVREIALILSADHMRSVGKLDLAKILISPCLQSQNHSTQIIATLINGLLTRVEPYQKPMTMPEFSFFTQNRDKVFDVGYVTSVLHFGYQGLDKIALSTIDYALTLEPENIFGLELSCCLEIQSLIQNGRSWGLQQKSKNIDGIDKKLATLLRLDPYNFVGNAIKIFPDLRNSLTNEFRKAIEKRFDQIDIVKRCRETWKPNISRYLDAFRSLKKLIEPGSITVNIPPKDDNLPEMDFSIDDLFPENNPLRDLTNPLLAPFPLQLNNEEDAKSDSLDDDFLKNLDPSLLALSPLPSENPRYSALVANIDQKYLEGGRVHEPRMESSSGVLAEWLKNPSVSFHKIEVKTLDNDVKSHRIETSSFTGTYFTKSTNLPQPTDRCTFIMMGRKENACIPTETRNDKVILVIPSNDLAQGRHWIGSNRDVLVIESFKDFATPSQLGLVTSRRLAALSFAYHYQLKSMIMIDDNLEKFYISKHLSEEQPTNWEALYHIFDATAQTHQLSCVSARTYRPDTDRDNQPNGDDLAVDEMKLGSKIFYLNIELLRKHVSCAEDLLPEDPAIWGEDFFMQGVITFAGAQIGTLTRKGLLFTRSRGHKNICAKVVRPANAWLSYQSRKIRPVHTAQAEEWITNEVKRNITANEQRKIRAENMDLGELNTRCVMKNIQKKRSGDSTLPLDVLLANKDIAKSKKRRMPKEIVQIEDVVMAESKSDFSYLLEEVTQACQTLQKVDVDGKTYNKIRIGERELVLNRPFREWQLQAIRALGKFLGPEEGLHGYFQAATGAGKTFVMGAISGILLNSQHFKKNVLVVTPTVQLVDQTYHAFVSFYNNVSPKLDQNKLISVSNEHISQQSLVQNKSLQKGGYCVIMCVNSLRMMLESDPTQISHFDSFIIDELHKIPKKFLEYFKTLAAKKDKIVLGLSATPENKELLGSCIFKYTSREGVEQKILSPWVVDRLELPYSEQNLASFFKALPSLQNIKRHPHGGLWSENKGFIYVRSVKEAQELEDHLIKNGVKAGALYSSKVNKIKIMEEFEKPTTSSTVNLLILVEMLKLGFDGKVDYAIIARNDLNEADWYQIRGRILREHAPTNGATDKKIAYVVVFQDAKLPADFVLNARNITLESKYLEHTQTLALSHRRQVVDQYAPGEIPSTPALILNFESLDHQRCEPLSLKSMCIIPLPYSDDALNQASALGVIWQQRNPEIDAHFKLMKGIFGKPANAMLRQKIRAQEKVEDSDSFALLAEATKEFGQLIPRISVEQKNHYLFLVYKYDETKQQFVFVEKQGNQKSRQVVYLYQTKRSGSVKAHYDLLIPA